MSRLLKLLFILLIFLSNTTFAQIGGKIKEVQNQKRLKRHIKRSGWVERKWVPNKLKVVEPQRKLFFRYKTSNSKIKEKIQKDINRKRIRRRIRGNDVFYKKKYF
jgi:hypothetical protein